MTGATLSHISLYQRHNPFRGFIGFHLRRINSYLRIQRRFVGLLQPRHSGRVAAPATLIEGALPDDLEVYLDAVERDILARALERHRNNRTAAGASLGLTLRQMRYRMARLGVVVTGNDE